MNEIKGYKVGLFPMVGDLLHAGHILALKEARSKCDRLVVAINALPDGKWPVQSLYERVVQVQAVSYVDEVICYQGRMDMEKIAATYDYDIRFLGSDYKGKEWDGKEQEATRGIEPCYIDRSHGFSSTELKIRVATMQAIEAKKGTTA